MLVVNTPPRRRAPQWEDARRVDRNPNENSCPRAIRPKLQLGLHIGEAHDSSGGQIGQIGRIRPIMSAELRMTRQELTPSCFAVEAELRG